MTAQALVGFKGGESKAKPPVESPDSLQSIAFGRILDLISEGEIRGLVSGERSVFLSETPAANQNGTLNFGGLKIDYRYGSQDQTYMEGFPAVESETAVGVALTQQQPWTHAINNLQLSAIRIRLAASRLFQTDTSNGNTDGYSVSYTISLSTDGGPFVPQVNSAFTGKTSSKYERSHRIELPPAVGGWTVRVIRTTPDSTTGSIGDTTTVDAFVDIIDAKLRYPGSAYIGTRFDASQFQTIPTRSFDCYGRIISVPSNYDPDSRAYTGVWDGSFKPAWTDNPAWIYYDLLLHYRYGLGHMLNAAQVDKWELYRIGQYCDQMVSDGKGRTEPRFTCNLYLTVRADALKVLQDLATTFRGISYWGAGSVITSSDMPEDPVYTYSNANVIDGKFVYSGSAKKTRYTVALVSWNDPTDFYRQKVQYVDDQDGIQRYGIQQTEITATGCTSQAQATRIGKWALLTNRLETESVQFSVGLDGVIARPGQIIRVADNDRAGRRIGGRLRSSTLESLVLDADVTAYPGDTITLIMPTGKAVSREIASVGYPLTWDATGITWDNGTITMDTTGFPSDVQQVTLVEPLEALPPMHSMWAIDSPQLVAQQFRIMSIAEDFSDDNMRFAISAVKHNSSKYAAIDKGAKIESPPITIIPPSVQQPPTDIVLSNANFVDQGSTVNVMTIQWAAAPSAIAYEVYWRKNDGDWIYAGRTGTTSVEVSGIYAGRYVAKVQAVNSLNIASIFATSVETVLNGKTTPPPVVTAFEAVPIVFGIKLNWTIPAGFGTADLQRSEIWFGTNSDLSSATKFGDYAYPQTDLTIMGLANGVSFFFWVRLVDKIGNVGAFYGPVNGQASSDAKPILDYLNGQITDTQLSRLLLEKIDSGGGAQVEVDALKSELAAMYTIKTQLTVDGVPYMAGIGIGVENDEGEITSQVLIAASRFAVVDPNSSEVFYPFVIQNGQVIMNSAFIGVGTITSAMIGEFIQSTNFVDGVSGWRLNKNGELQINGSGGKGRFRLIESGLYMYDLNNKLRIRMEV
ncbi:host specificity protein J [Pseudomonas sp. S25]|uniref:Host specificity protein J n=1 Tax=Pseudomonas maioricensis TaxID=1766623 RepID=A0ABS9ZKN0_9PSED|nr:host specificity protein J [Pseudomonas sp. S25]MCI8210787.1 host specificity protein J [Pseudomonas sp. S25]